MSINRVVLTGRLTKDVELRATPSGANVASFTIAVDGFTKVTDKCVEKMFAREGETVEEAKKRLSGE